MRKLFTGIAVVCSMFVFAGLAQANVTLFSDTFDGTTIDTSKWSAVGSYGTISQNDEAIIRALGIGAGNAGVSLQSSAFDIPFGTKEVIFSGTWRLHPSAYTFEPFIFVYNADNPSQYARVGYVTYNGDPHANSLKFSDTVTAIPAANAYYSRAQSSSDIPFALRFTDSGWSYEENGTTFKTFTSDITDGIDSLYVRIGAWDYSSSTYEYVYFDDICVEADVPATPEPASLALLISGIFGLGFLRRKK